MGSLDVSGLLLMASGLLTIDRPAAIWSSCRLIACAVELALCRLIWLNGACVSLREQGLRARLRGCLGAQASRTLDVSLGRAI